MVNTPHSNYRYIRLPIILISYFSISLYFLFFKDFQYGIDPDITSYISIAQKYLAGDFANAINAQWSPMASWLMLPLLITEIRPILAIGLTSVTVGGVVLAGISLLMKTIGVRDNFRFFYCLSLSPLIALYGLTLGLPGMANLCFLTYYMYIIIRDDFKTTRYRGIIAGLFAGLAFLSKSYNFYFFLLHFPCIIFFYLYSTPDKSQRKIIITNGLSAILVFVFISSPWIGLLTNKYNKFMITSAGEYNFSLERPGSLGHMPETDGLMAPTNETAFSAWEDPTYIEKVPWSPFNSIADFQYFIKHTAFNTAKYALYLTRNPIYFFTIIYLIIFFISLSSNALQSKSFYLLFTTFLHPIGFMMLHFEDRYLLINYVLLYVLGGYIIDIILKKTDITRLQKTAFATIMCAYIAVYSLSSFFYWINTVVLENKNLYLLSKEIKQSHDFQNTNVASQTDNWVDALCLSYYLKAKYYGKVKEDIADEQLRKKLLSFKIQYYFVYGELKNQIDILEPFKQFDDISIYKVLEPSLINNNNNSL